MVKRRAETLQRLATLYARLEEVLSSAGEDDDDEDVPSQDDVGACSQHARARKAFAREKPRVRERDGHARWYGEWGTGFWGQYMDRETVKNHSLLRDEFEERFRIPHELFCDFEDEMTTAGLFQKPTKS